MERRAEDIMKYISLSHQDLALSEIYDISISIRASHSRSGNKLTSTTESGLVVHQIK